MKEQYQLMDYLGQFAIAHIIMHVLCICVAYWGLNAVRLDQFSKGISITSTSHHDIFGNSDWHKCE